MDANRLTDPAATAFGCGTQKYPIDMRAAFGASALATMEKLVEDVQLVDRPAPLSTLAHNGYAGQIILKSEKLDTQLRLISSLASDSIEGALELTVSMIVDGRNGRLLVTLVQEEGKAHVQGGFNGGCGKGGEAIGEAAEESLKRTLTVIGERLSNSPRIRDYATGDQ